MIKSSNNRISYKEIKETRHDDFTYAGFDYEGKQLKLSVSSYLKRIPMVNEFIKSLDTLIFYTTEKTKLLMQFRNFAMKQTHTKFR